MMCIEKSTQFSRLVASSLLVPKLSSWILRLSAQQLDCRKMTHAWGGRFSAALWAVPVMHHGKHQLPVLWVIPNGWKMGFKCQGFRLFRLLGLSPYEWWIKKNSNSYWRCYQPQSLKSCTDSPAWLSPHTCLHHSLHKHSGTAAIARNYANEPCQLHPVFFTPGLLTNPFYYILVPHIQFHFPALFS